MAPAPASPIDLNSMKDKCVVMSPEAQPDEEIEQDVERQKTPLLCRNARTLLGVQLLYAYVITFAVGARLNRTALVIGWRACVSLCWRNVR